MRKQEYLEALGKALAGLPADDAAKALAYYSEAIDDHMEDGMAEEKAVEALGSVEEAAEKVLEDTPLSRLVKERMKPRGLRVWEILLLVLGSPVWVPLVLAGICILLVIYLLIWVLAVVFYCIILTLTAYIPVGLLGFLLFLVRGMPAQAFLLLGAGFFCGGIAFLLLPAANRFAVLTARLGRRFARGIKTMFIGRKDK